MKVLITGGFGFLGARLAISLASEGHAVRLGTRTKKDLPSWLPTAEPVVLDLISGAGTQEACKGVDVIVHAAGLNAGECANDPVEALKVNGLGTANMLESAIKEKAGKFIYLSTAHVYASPLQGTITEKTCTTNCHPYATSHKAGEDVVKFASMNNDIDGQVVRLSNVYGVPAQAETNCWMLVFNDLCRQVATTGAIKLLSTGNQRRDFISMSDFCNAIKCLIQQDSSAKKEDVYNISSGWTPTIMEVAKIVQALFEAKTGRRPEITANLLATEPNSSEFYLDSSRMKALGFKAQGKDDQEIKSLLEFCLANFSDKSDHL